MQLQKSQWVKASSDTSQETLVTHNESNTSGTCAAAAPAQFISAKWLAEHCHSCGAVAVSDILEKYME